MSIRRPAHVAVLGAGIMGSSVALFLARKGVHVTLVDIEDEPFCGASRWNEGKIHLGYLYAGDPTRKTARGLLPGGMAFKRLTEELIGCSLQPVITPEDDIYLVHGDSVVSAKAMEHYFNEITTLVRAHPDSNRYLVDTSHSKMHALSHRELAGVTDSPVIVGGYRVPERSVQTDWVADRFIEALDAEPRIELALSTRVKRVRPAGATIDGPWLVDTNPVLDSAYDSVINALWQERLTIDATAGLEPEAGWSHRYRLSLFVRTARRVNAPSAVLATGPFGDIKNYTGSDFYLSWYPTGLLAEGHAESPPAVPDLNELARNEIIHSIIATLGDLLPAVKSVAAEAVDVALEGGWVFALGRGSLADPHATLHRRDRFGVRRHGSYVSIDTGKYSTAPWLARQIADSMTGDGA